MNIKELLKGALKLGLSLLVLNLILDGLSYFGFSTARQIVYSPLSTVLPSKTAGQ